MKLATLKNGSRDGKLVIVSRDLTRFTDASFLAPTLQAALDDWRRMSPHLAALAESLEVGAVPSARFHENDAHSPLPRAYQHIGGADAFVGPRDPVLLAGDVGTAKVVACAAVVVDDVRFNASAADAKAAIVLVMLAAPAYTTAGDARSPLASAFSPVAVTPDELGGEWSLPLHVSINGKPSGEAIGAIDFPALVAKAASTRPLGAGAIVAGGSTGGAALRSGDTLRIEVKDKSGHSIFGAIEQLVQ